MSYEYPAPFLTDTHYPSIHPRFSVKSFACRTYEKYARKSFRCRTYKNKGLKVLYLPHIRKNPRGPPLFRFAKLQPARCYNSLNP